MPLVTLALAITGAASTSRTNAAFVINITQSRGDVVAEGSGSVNTSALTLSTVNSNLNPAKILASFAFIDVGGISGQSRQSEWKGISGPDNFGVGDLFNATAGSGDPVMVVHTNLLLPVGYSSNDPLLDTATWSGQTFSSLGLTPGTYTWTWGSGATADAVVLNIESPIPEPASIGLIGLGTAFAFRRRRSLRVFSPT